jgi:hypothetical protein
VPAPCCDGSLFDVLLRQYSTPTGSAALAVLQQQSSKLHLAACMRHLDAAKLLRSQQLSIVRVVYADSQASADLCMVFVWYDLLAVQYSRFT